MLLGVDVGGTFTDAVVFDGRALHTAKAPTTPEDQSRGVLAAVEGVPRGDLGAGRRRGHRRRRGSGVLAGHRRVVAGRQRRPAPAADQHEQAAEAERESREALQATVRNYSDFAARVADGDLTATVAAGGSEELQELARSLNRMVEGLAEISREIQVGVGDMGSSTADILAAVSNHTENAGQQSAAIQQTSATVDELRWAALHDPLTGLTARPVFLDEL